MLNSEVIAAQLKESLRDIKIFMMFGSVVIIFFLFFIQLMGAKSNANSNIFGSSFTKCISYIIVIPYLIFYYLYKPIKDIQNINKFFINVEHKENNCTGTLINLNKILVQESIDKELIILAGAKFLCVIYYKDNKKFYFPNSITRKGFKII